MVLLIVWLKGYNQNVNCIPSQGHCNNMYNLAYISKPTWVASDTNVAYQVVVGS